MKNSKPFKLLKTVALTGAVVIALSSPFGGTKLIQELIGNYLEKKRFAREKFLQDLKRLQTRKLINYRELNDERIEITITKRGEEKVLQYKIDEMALKMPKQWDGLWRLVMFDIPHYHKKARDAFRRKLGDLKFYPLQKSVFITPYPCEDEIDFLGTFYKIRSCVLVLYVKNFEGEEKLRHYFHI